MTIRWITPLLGTAPAGEMRDATDIQIIDVRDLVDKAGNRPNTVREKVMQGAQSLKAGRKTVVCCDYGISRSNAIAAGILALYENIAFNEAVRSVQSATGETEIKLEPLNVVRQALESEDGKNPEQFGKRAVLVTGASGFVGSAVCKLLEKEFTVIAPSRKELDIEQGSTQLSLLVSEHNIECIIHLANPRVYTSNVALGRTLIMLRNVLDVCVSQKVQLIYPSGWEIYSGYAGTILADESVPPFPLGPYGETKYLAEVMIDHWQRTTNIRCTLLRSSPVYGAGGNKPKFIYNFIEKAKRSEPIITHHYLNGPPALDLLYLDDFADAIIRAFKKGYIGTLNLGTGILTTTRDIAEVLKAELDSSSSLEYTSIEATTACIAMDYRRAEYELGWRPTIMLQDGLRQVLAYN